MTHLLIALIGIAFAAETNLPTAKLQIGKSLVEVQVADTSASREHGLMNVTKLAPNEGMLFVFDDERELGFWMKNTLIPLSIGYFDAQGKLVNMQEMEPAESMMVKDLPVYKSGEPAQFALEMNKGWFTKNHIKVGAKLELLKKSSSESLNRKLKIKSP